MIALGRASGILAVLVVMPDPAFAQRSVRNPFSCGPFTLQEQFGDSTAVFVGRLQNAVEPNNALPDGQVELTIDEVITPHASLKGRKSIVIGRHVPVSKEKYLVAVDLHKGKFETVRAMRVDEKRDIVNYGLQCPAPAAQAFIVAERSRDPGFVADVKELLELESRDSCRDLNQPGR